MTDKTKKALILAFLQSQSQAISLRDIQAHSGVDLVAERTLRRWLSEWVNQGIVSKIGEHALHPQRHHAFVFK